MMKRIAILGSTGSIGVNTLDVISRLKSRYRVVALSAESNIDLLSEQARRFHPRIVSIGSALLSKRVKISMPSGVKVVAGLDGLKEIVTSPDVDQVIFAIAGGLCAIPLLEAIEKRKEVALANKESIVIAGDIIMEAARRKDVRIIPIDSEHSAIFQCLEGRRQYLSKIILTGSGGPLLRVPQNRFDKFSRNFILRHPKWKMGRKISVDSATMMNKGLEVIEAKHLFGVREEMIEVLIHPEAIVHSMVELIDGSVLAQLGVPDMRIPIQYAITYPERSDSVSDKVDFAGTGRLSFEKPDTGRFRCLTLAISASRKGGTFPAVLNAADEEAVRYYLDGKIKFSSIPKIIERVLMRHKCAKNPVLNIGDLMKADAWAREEARSLCYH